MTYCVSDIHGEWNLYNAMLEHIKFSDSDTLYIIGDVIDRHPFGVDILLDIMERPNVHMILGNHEQMCLDDLYWHEPDARQLWHQNGGRFTRRDLLYRRPEVRAKVLQFMRGLPSELDIEVSGQKFKLVHGFPAAEKYDRIWMRPERDAPAPVPGVTVIVGHTPTVFLNDCDWKPFHIWHGDGIIDIDCGCGNTIGKRRLACLRLDDMEEFYVSG